MFKLIKYELIGRYKLIVGGLVVLALINLLLIIGFNFWWQGGMEAAFAISLAFGFLGMFIVALDAVNIVRRDLYNDSGYLLFTLPKSGYSILGAKLIVGVLEMVMFIVFQLFISFIIIAPNIKGEFWELVNALVKVTPEIFYVFIIAFWSIISLLLTISFSIVLAKSILNTKRYGNLASFGAFIAISSLIGFIVHQLQKIPWTMVLHLRNINMKGLSLQATGVLINIPEVIFEIVLPVALFAAAGYLIENKLEMR